MARILIVEDEQSLARGIQFNLELEGHDVTLVGDGPGALAALDPQTGDRHELVILDVMLPGGLDGFEVARRAREAGNFAPILMLTAKGMAEDVVRGLEAGADDYLTKPFDLGVLLARVKGLLRRRDWARGPAGETSDLARIGDVEIDFASFELKGPHASVRLTLLEAMLLEHLVQHAGRVVSKAELLEKVWNVSPDSETRSVDNFVVRLRRYLEPNPRFPRFLQTVRGAGYRLDLEG
jgi:DNA-binding response OmpR family regulator